MITIIKYRIQIIDLGMKKPELFFSFNLQNKHPYYLGC